MVAVVVIAEVVVEAVAAVDLVVAEDVEGPEAVVA